MVYSKLNKRKTFKTLALTQLLIVYVAVSRTQIQDD